jgi:hypothetical protein
MLYTDSVPPVSITGFAARLSNPGIALLGIIHPIHCLHLFIEHDPNLLFRRRIRCLSPSYPGLLTKENKKTPAFVVYTRELLTVRHP